MHRDEFTLYDTIKTVNMLKLIMCVMIGFMGKKALCAAAWQKAWSTKKSMRRCYKFTAILFVLGFVVAW